MMTFVAVVCLVAAASCAEISLDQQSDDGASGGGNDAGSSGGAATSQALDGPVGSLGSVLLSSSTSGVVIEVDSTQGRSLTDRARRALEENLREHGGKDDINYAGSSTVPSKDRYSDDDLRSIAADNRDADVPDGSTGIYVLVLDGRYSERKVAGVAFNASSFAIFPEQFEGGVLGSLSYDQIEEAVVVHELGHLFGLVNLTGEGGFHEDPDHPGHSENEDSVMFWRVEDDSVARFFGDGPPTSFDADDRKEMERIRG